MKKKVSIKKVISGITALIVTAVLFTLINYYSIVLPVLLSIIAAVCVLEFCALFEKKEIYIPKLLTLFFSIFIIWDSYLTQGVYFDKILIIYLIIIPFQEIITKKKLHNFTETSLGLFAIIYIGALLSYGIKLWELDKSIKYLILTVLLTATTDIFCYFGGVKFGKRKMFPILSPNKTIEGWMTGILFTVLISIIIFKIPALQGYFSISLDKLVILAVLIGIFGQIGDLFESAIKRSIGVKDTGDLIPEHGGLLDRIDSILFTSILSYYFLIYLR